MAAAPGTRTELLPRRLIRALAGFAVALLLAGPAEASLLPAGFFDMDVKPGQGSAAVEADRMTDDAKAHLIIAEGNATVSYGGSVIKADRIEYDQNTGGVHAIGHVVLRDHTGDIYQMNEVTVTGGMKQAFINSLTLTTSRGSLITADNVNYSSELQTILTDATYSPCGLCIDSKGRHIGWQVKAARMVYDRKSASITMDQPTLAVLGIPVAWLPWFWLPDPSQPRAAGIRLPSVGYDPKRGAIATLPYFQPIGPDIDMLLSPTLMSRQGFLGKVNLDWRLPDYGEVDVRASGIDQLTPSAYAGTVGDRSWRGAIQTSGSFKPLKDWTAGWSYSAFSDGDYLYDYEMDDSESSTNDVHVTYLHEQTWFDARIETFNRLGTDLTAATDNDNQQAIVLPKVSADHVQDLAPGWGRVHVTAEALGVDRVDDDQSTFNGVPYDFGFAGAKQHAMVQGNWENQWILPGGVTAVPYVGMRLDAAEYDGASTLPSAPPATFLLSATPIAAMDVRWPLMAVDGSDTHLLEPIAQLVYRGSSTSDVGITNDDSQGFVFDDSNLFSYDRFSGIDRQETGLRANLGAHYLGNFGNGSWLDLVAGESFQLAGSNAFDALDPTLTGVDSGLDSTASYLVAGARAGFTNGITVGTKVQVDPSAPRVTRAGLGVTWSPGNRFSVGATYVYVAADPTLGLPSPQHEIAGSVSLPVDDYWTVNGGLTYNIAAANWIKANAALTYDDGYFSAGVFGDFAPTDYTVGVHLKLKGPDGSLAF